MANIHYNLDIEHLNDIRLNMPVMLLVPLEDVDVGTKGKVRETNSNGIVVEWEEGTAPESEIAPEGKVIDVFNVDQTNMLAFGHEVDELGAIGKELAELVGKIDSATSAEIQRVVKAITSKFWLKRK